MQQEQTNKTIIRDFYRRAVGQGDIAWAETIIANDYIQHSTYVKPGKRGLLESLEQLKQMPKPVSTTPPFMRLIAEGDMVVTNMSFSWGGKQKAVVDVFRLKDGKIAEHWDVMQDQPDYSRNGRALLDGPQPAEAPEQTGSNKALVAQLYPNVFVGTLGAVPLEGIDQEVQQHCPDIADGWEGLRAYLREPTNRPVVDTVHRLIAEGNFVVVHAEGRQHNQAVALVDIFRMQEGKIVEQWRIKQVLP